METRDLKQKTISSMIWNAIQRFGTMVLSFGTNIVLARMLLPDDFGCIGMLTIFLALSEVFIDGGFGSALIQKKNPTQEDFSTIFYWNLIVSTFLFLVLQFAAPYIAAFYHMPQLCDLLRVLSIVLIINGFTVVQSNILTKQLSFRLMAKIRLCSTAVAMIVSVIAAYLGMGVWSLVIKDLLAALLGSVLFWTFNKWRPSFVFSSKSFRELFSFGGLMLLSSIMNSLFENIQGLVIGKYFTAKDLGYYSQSKRLDQIITTSLSQVVTHVSFPVLSQVADNKSLLVRTIRKNIIVTTYVIFPLEILLISISEPLIITLLSEKWVSAIPYYRIFCIYGMFISLNAINSSVYKALGDSKMFFIVQFTKRFVGICLLLLGVKYGVIGITWSIAVSGFVWWMFNSIVNVRAIGYGFLAQIKDVYQPFIVAVCLGFLVYYFLNIIAIPKFVQLVICIFLYSSLYLIISWLLNFEGFCVIVNEVLRKYMFHK